MPKPLDMSGIHMGGATTGVPMTSARGGGQSIQETACIESEKHQPAMPTTESDGQNNQLSPGERATSKKEAEPTPDKLADNSHSDHVDAIELDQGNSDQDRVQLEGEKSTLREATPDHNNERNSLEKAFPERPSEVLLEGEKRTLREATPGQPRDKDSCEGQSHHQEMELLSWPLRLEPEDSGQQHLNKVDECPDKVAPPTVNKDEE